VTGRASNDAKEPMRRILIAEDEPTSAALLVRALKKLNFEVDVADNGQVAAELLEAQPYRIILSDWMMPGLEGPELCQRARRYEGRPYTYIILLTSKTTREDRLIGLQAGADDLIAKPIDLTELEAKLGVAERILTMEDANRRVANDLQLTAAKLTSMNEMLDHASQRFQELFEGLPIACFTCDSEGRIFEWNRACENLYMFDGTIVMQNTIWDTICRPEDHEWFREYLARVFAGERPDPVERLDRRGDGTTRLVLSTVLPISQRDGVVVGAICTNVDITERKENEERLRLLSLVAQRSTNGILILDAEQQVLFANDAFYGMTGYSMREMVGRNPMNLMIGPESDPAAVSRMTEAIASCRPTSVEVLCYHRSGRTYWGEVHLTPLAGPDGQLTHVIALTNDITGRIEMQRRLEEEMRRNIEYADRLEIQRSELQKANARLAAIAKTDGLTNLLNRAALETRLEQEFTRCKARAADISVVILDVDHFKRYNDTFGHPAGDEVLRTIAQTLQANVRSRDFVARYGGEEFIIVLPGADRESAAMIAEKLRSAIETRSWPNQQVTASFGVAGLGPEMDEYMDLVAAADQALYVSKREGRNRVTLAWEMPDAA
jgi:diguanylate cyclase (GGDEF)-like protein/PAS domain S-box-containing protein